MDRFCLQKEVLSIYENPFYTQKRGAAPQASKQASRAPLLRSVA